MKRVWALAICALSACNDNDGGAVTGSSFDPVHFFSGHTRGDATLNLITGAKRHVSVDSHGLPDGHGGLRLDQTIREEGKPARSRRWLLKPASTDHWTGTLSDADGPVAVERTPADVIITYRMTNGAHVEQHLRMPPGGVVENRMAVSRFGIELASLDERIRKVGR